MNTTTFVLQRLPYVIPMLIVCAVGIVLSVIRLRRGTYAALVLAGCGVLFVSTIALFATDVYFYDVQRTRTFPLSEVSRWFTASSIARVGTQAFALSMILAAAFTGRRGTSEPQLPTVEPDQDSPRPHHGGLVFLMGVLSVVVFPLIGIPTWLVAGSHLKAMRAGKMDRSGYGLTAAGHVLGIIGTALFGLGVAAVLALAVLVSGAFGKI